MMDCGSAVSSIFEKFANNLSSTTLEKSKELQAPVDQNKGNPT